MDKVLFIKEFVKNWKEVGSVTPSSPFLVRKMLAPIDFEKAKIVVELGPGSGVFTRGLLSKMLPDAKLLAFETNKEFCQELEKIGDTRLSVYNDSASNLEKYLDGRSVDYVVSGIPLANLDNTDKQNLLSTAYRSLTPGGKYIQFQYTLESRSELQQVFDNVSIGFTLFNIPPAFVYTCVKK